MSWCIWSRAPRLTGWAMALLRAGRCSRSCSGRVSDSMAAELTAAWRRCSRFSRVGGPPGQAVEQLCGRLSRAAGQSPEVVGLERLVEGLLSREHVGRKYLFHLHHVGFQQCHLGLDPVLQDPPGGASGLVLASGGIGNHYPPSSAGNRPGPQWLTGGHSGDLVSFRGAGSKAIVLRGEMRPLKTEGAGESHPAGKNGRLAAQGWPSGRFQALPINPGER